MCICLPTDRTHAQMYTSGEPLLLFSLGAQPLTGRQCEHSKQKPDSLNWPLTRSCRQVVVAKRTVSVSAQWAHCGPQAAAPQDMSSVGLCQYWLICILSYNVYLHSDVWVFLTDNNRFPLCEKINYMRLQCIQNAKHNSHDIKLNNNCQTQLILLLSRSGGGRTQSLHFDAIEQFKTHGINI